MILFREVSQLLKLWKNNDYVTDFFFHVLFSDGTLRELKRIVGNGMEIDCLTFNKTTPLILAVAIPKNHQGNLISAQRNRFRAIKNI